MNQRTLNGWLLTVVLVALLPACSSRSANNTQPAAASPTPTVADLIKQTDELYKGRDELDRVRESIVILRGLRVAEERNYEVLWRLARNSHYLAENAADAAERESAYAEGISAARVATVVEPERVEGHFWLGANLAGRMSLQGVIGDLAAVSDVRREMEFVIARDEGFQMGGAYMVLAGVESEIPRVLGGDKGRAVELLEKGLKFGEGNALLRLRLAVAYLAVKRREDARRELQFVIASEPHPDFVPEHKRAVAEAQRILKEQFEKEQPKGPRR